MADVESKLGTQKTSTTEPKTKMKPAKISSPAPSHAQEMKEQCVRESSSLSSPQKKKTLGKENSAEKRVPEQSPKTSELVSSCLPQELSNEPLKLVDASKDDGQKSKAQLRAERRAVQEAQRKAKEEKKGGVPEAKTQTVGAVSANKKVESGTSTQPDKKPATAAPNKKSENPVELVDKSVNLFSHLPQYRHGPSLTSKMLFHTNDIHPAILKLGVQYASGTICGSNARCIGLLDAFKKVIGDYTTPPQKELSRDLASAIKPYISYLSKCRPLSVSMASAIKCIKHQINHMPSHTTDTEAKEILFEAIDTFYKERIEDSDDAIARVHAQQKISNGDVILIYAWSSLVLKVLTEAHTLKKTFRVIVVDARPKLEGRKMLRRLVQQGIHCTYALINSVSYIMKEVTKVLVGAHSLLANGYVMSRVGTSQVALVAHAYGVPVLVCCETYKFSEKVQTDSFVWNELGDPDELLKTGSRPQQTSHRTDSLTFLNLVYDVTPPKYITMVITEMGMIPCTSAPVVLRVKQHIDE